MFTFGDVVVKMGLPTAGLDADISAALWRATLLCAARLAGLKTVLSTGDGDDVNSPDGTSAYECSVHVPSSPILDFLSMSHADSPFPPPLLARGRQTLRQCPSPAVSSALSILRDRIHLLTCVQRCWCHPGSRRRACGRAQLPRLRLGEQHCA